MNESKGKLKSSIKRVDYEQVCFFVEEKDVFCSLNLRRDWHGKLKLDIHCANNGKT